MPYLNKKNAGQMRKKTKLHNPNQYKFTTVNCLFKTYKNVAHTRYYCSHPNDNLSTQEHTACGAIVSAFERSIKNIIKGFSISARLPWHLVDDVYISMNSDGKFHWVLVSSLDTYKDKKTGMLLGPQHDFEVEFVQDIMQQESDSLDCGMFVVAFVEFLSDGIPISNIEFRSEYLRTQYAALLCKYGTEKAKAG
ncbi:hypothetical protein H5410_050781 [Solanum commersonii]|uniref:Ubiquitin-like protease family profile domain-containing protein n=1 Tax=Solanum commersonii TaxID=4109 RepID=A0A9J5WWJ3_SOLCO|nr:hypothetical protein H5410_050781 [Solanum commersonii]